MPDSGPPPDRAFRSRLADRLAELRLAIDLGEIESAADFRAALERGGSFTADDQRVRDACFFAGLGAWLS